jgi:hypothetical protein
MHGKKLKVERISVTLSHSDLKTALTGGSFWLK